MRHQYAVAYVPPLAHTRVRGGLVLRSCSRSEGGFFAALPRNHDGETPSLRARWRPSARLTTERYVNEQIPNVRDDEGVVATHAEHRELYQIAAPVIKRGGNMDARLSNNQRITLIPYNAKLRSAVTTATSASFAAAIIILSAGSRW